MAHNSLIITHIITSVWNQVQGFNNCEIKESIFARYDFFWLLSIGEVRQLTNYSTIGKMVNTNVKSTFDTMKIGRVLLWPYSHRVGLHFTTQNINRDSACLKIISPFPVLMLLFRKRAWPLYRVELGLLSFSPPRSSRLPRTRRLQQQCNNHHQKLGWDHLENQAVQKL